MSDELRYAVKKGILDSFRYLSDTFFDTINEAKAIKDSLEFLQEDLDLINSDAGSFGDFDGHQVPLDLPIEDDTEEIVLSKSKHGGKDVELNKPKRGDTKKFVVYVRDSKSGNIKKINFGLNVTRALLSDPARQRAFASRHGCEQANDKTTPKYWACRTVKFFHKIYGGEKISGRWW